MSQEGLFDEPTTCPRCRKPEPREWCWEGRTNDCPLGYGPRRWGGDQAHARTGDPVTSHEAAASIASEKIRRSQQAILEMFKGYGPMYDQQLVERYLFQSGIDSSVPTQSESGIRTRRSELVTKGLVADSGAKALLVSGRRTIIWRAT